MLGDLKVAFKSALPVLASLAFAAVVLYWIQLTVAKQGVMQDMADTLENSVTRAMFMSTAPRFDIAEVRYDLDGKAVEAECSAACTGGNHPVTVRYPSAIGDAPEEVQIPRGMTVLEGGGVDIQLPAGVSQIYGTWKEGETRVFKVEKQVNLDGTAEYLDVRLGWHNRSLEHNDLVKSVRPGPGERVVVLTKGWDGDSRGELLARSLRDGGAILGSNGKTFRFTEKANPDAKRAWGRSPRSWLQTTCSCAKPVPSGSQTVRTEDVDVEGRMVGGLTARGDL